ncbi:MAG: hypothetical protein JW795_02500 [Chitinivibrionales bacterium]|nr:hypothetical protein [Chitinivibrionales bacterium]
MSHLRYVSLLVCATLLFLILRCTNSSVNGGNGSETTNGIMSVMVLATDGSAAKGALVSCIPRDFNPLTDTFNRNCYSDTTDENGIARINLKDGGLFNISAIDKSSTCTDLKTNILLRDYGDNLLTLILKPKSSLTILLPESVDTVYGAVFCLGSQIKLELAHSYKPAGGYIAIQFDSLPATTLPPFYYTSGTQTTVISNALSLLPQDTLQVAWIGENSIKPVWRFSMLIAVDKEVSSYYSGLTNTMRSIQRQITDASRLFNQEKKFQAVLYFSCDSSYVYDRSLSQEMAKPLNGFDYRILYHATSECKGTPEMYQDIIKRYSSIYIAGPPSKLFQNKCTEIVTSLLAELRGCLHLTFCAVDSTKNPINHKGYTGINSYLNTSYSVTNHDTKSRSSGDDRYGKYWDTYSLSVINTNTDRIGCERDILYTAFPDSMGIQTFSKQGTSVAGAKVSVYGVELKSSAVSEKALYDGITDTAGRFSFPTNPFKDSTGNMLQFGNFLITANTDDDSTYGWFPLFQAGKAYFLAPDTVLFWPVRFKN